MSTILDIRKCIGCESILNTLDNTCDWCINTYGKVIPKIEDTLKIKSTTNRKVWDQIYNAKPEVIARKRWIYEEYKRCLKKLKKLPKCKNCQAVIKNKDNKCIWCTEGYGNIKI